MDIFIIKLFGIFLSKQPKLVEEPSVRHKLSRILNYQFKTNK